MTNSKSLVLQMNVQIKEKKAELIQTIFLSATFEYIFVTCHFINTLNKGL